MGEWNQHRREDGDEPEITYDTILLAGTKKDLIEIVERVRLASENVGLYLNVENVDYQGRTMREGSARKNSYG